MKKNKENENINEEKISNFKKSYKKKKINCLKLTLFIILLLLILFVFSFIFKTFKNGGGTRGLLTTAMGQSKEDIENLEPISVLLLGSSQNLTDTILVLKYNPQTQKTYLVSIPRDTFVGNNKTTAKSSEKINSLYQGKHPQKTLTAVNKITGLNLKYYVIVDTQALKALVDAIGGVYFDVPIDMNYTDKKQNLYIDLKAGYQLLDGNKAEQVVRFRHNQDGTTYSTEYGDNDIGRMKTQRNFLKAVMKQTLKPGNILNVGKFIDIAKTYVETNIPINTIKQYIVAAVNFNTDNLETDSLPGIPEKCNGVWLYIPNNTKIKNFFNTMDLKLANISEISKDELANVKIELLNGSGKTSTLNNVKKKLTNAGFTISKTKTTNSTQKTSIINKSNVSENIILSLKSLLEGGTVSSSETKSDYDITIILGKDI